MTHNRHTAQFRSSPADGVVYRLLAISFDRYYSSLLSYARKDQNHHEMELSHGAASGM